MEEEEEEEEEKKKEDSEAMLLKPATRDFASCTGKLECEESLVGQHMANVESKDCLLFFSRFHSGGSQQSLGRKRDRVDFCVVQAPGVLDFVNYHEAEHYTSGKNAHCSSCDDATPEGGTLILDEYTKEMDLFKFGLAAALTASKLIHVVYSTRNACDYFHGSVLGERNKILDFSGEDYILPPDWMREPISQKDLVEKLLNGEGGGFVVLDGGVESVKDEAAKVTGFCLQRSSVTPAELGPEALSIVASRVNIKRRKKDTDEEYQKRREKSALTELTRRGKGPYTLLRKSFVEATAIPVQQFRWLVQKRGLKDYTVLHYIHYSERNYLSDFLLRILQKRHELNLAGHRGSLKAVVYKLVLNAFVSIAAAVWRTRISIVYFFSMVLRAWKVLDIPVTPLSRDLR